MSYETLEDAKAALLKEEQDYLDALQAYNEILGQTASSMPLPGVFELQHSPLNRGYEQAATQPYLRQDHPELAKAAERLAKEEGEYRAVDEAVASFAQGNCSIGKYTADKVYEYYAMMEMVYKLATDGNFREQVVAQISEAWSGSAVQNLMTSVGSGMLAAEQNQAAGSLILFGMGDKAQELMDSAEANRQQSIESGRIAAQKIGEYFSKLWDEIKKKYLDCGLFYAVATVGIDGAFFVGELYAGLAFLRALKFVATRIGGVMRVFVRGVDSDKPLGQIEVETDALDAKYGKPEENHLGGYEPDTNRELPDKSAEEVLEERRRAEAAERDARMEPPPDGAPDWVTGRDPSDPPGVYRASDGKAAIQHPDTGKWTVPQGLGQHKGSFGEYIGTHNLESAGNTPLLPKTNLGDVTNSPGIDQLYKSKTPPPPLLVVESKYRSGDPFDVKDFPSPKAGPQMSRPWIRQHADDLLARGAIDDITHDQIMRGKYTPVLQRIGSDGKVQNIDLKTGKDIDTGEQVFEPEELLNWRDKK